MWRKELKKKAPDFFITEWLFFSKTFSSGDFRCKKGYVTHYSSSFSLYRTFCCVLSVELICVLLCLLVAILRFPATNLEGQQNWIGKDHPLIASQFFVSKLNCKIGKIVKSIWIDKDHSLITNKLCCLNFKTPVISCHQFKMFKFRNILF